MRAVLELLRPANVLTAAADVVAGYVIAGAPNLRMLAALMCASMSFYAGGVVLNDLVDRKLDAVERPERPIPSGRVSARAAGVLVVVLLTGGVLAAFTVSPEAGIVGLTLAAAILGYNLAAKRHATAGPLVMGACRGLNLVLGLAATATALTTWWPLGLLSATYIAGVTAVSRGEVLGGDRHARRAGLVLVTLAVAALVLISVSAPASRWAAATIAGILACRVLPAYWAAARTPDPAVARRAVRTGVLSLVLLDAALAAAYAGPLGAAGVLAAGVLAGSLARIFAVT